MLQLHARLRLANCAKVGVKCICYNFMPVFDWLRTDLKFVHPDGANSLAYDGAALAALDPDDLHLPGWDESYSKGELGALLAEYKGMTHEQLTSWARCLPNTRG